MIETIPLHEIEKHADSIYEAIVVRARQINDDQKQLLRHEYQDEYEIFDEEEPEERPMREDYIRLPKPSTLALEEFMAGKLTYEYLEEQENEPDNE